MAWWHTAPMACEGCGGEIPKRPYRYGGEVNPRTDAKYCSSACRQKAYRARKKKAKAARPAELPGQLGIPIPTTRTTRRSPRRA